MQLLFLTSRLPYPPDRGDRRRVFDFIKMLSTEHKITLLSFIADNEERKYLSALEEYCQSVQVVLMKSWRSAITVGLNFWRNQPLQTMYYRSLAMQNSVDQTLSETDFDAIYVHLFRMAPYVVNTPELYRIVDLTDVISQEILRSVPYRGFLSKILYRIELPRIERYERWVAEAFEEIWLISEHDRSVLAQTCSKANIQIVPHGVDTDFFLPVAVDEIPNSIIFVGHMSVFHNVDAVTYLAKEILPMVRDDIPDVALQIVGAKPNQQVQKLAQEPGVEVTGYVQDLNLALNRGAVFVAPLRFAAGVQTKVVEAMAAGRGVVVTSLVNQGIGAQPDRDLLIADTPVEISSAIVRLLRDSELRQRLGSSARDYVQQHFSWDLVLDRLMVIRETRK